MIYLWAASMEAARRWTQRGQSAVLDAVEGTRTNSSAADRLLLEVTVLKTFKSRRKHQVDLYIPNRGNPRVIIKGPEGDRADIHFEWFERERATKIAEMIAAGFSAKETTPTKNRPT